MPNDAPIQHPNFTLANLDALREWIFEDSKKRVPRTQRKRYLSFRQAEADRAMRCGILVHHYHGPITGQKVRSVRRSDQKRPTAMAEQFKNCVENSELYLETVICGDTDSVVRTIDETPKALKRNVWARNVTGLTRLSNMVFVQTLV